MRRGPRAVAPTLSASAAWILVMPWNLSDLDAGGRRIGSSDSYSRRLPVYIFLLMGIALLCSLSGWIDERTARRRITVTAAIWIVWRFARFVDGAFDGAFDLGGGASRNAKRSRTGLGWTWMFAKCSGSHRSAPRRDRSPLHGHAGLAGTIATSMDDAWTALVA